MAYKAPIFYDVEKNKTNIYQKKYAIQFTQDEKQTTAYLFKHGYQLVKNVTSQFTKFVEQKNTKALSRKTMDGLIYLIDSSMKLENIDKLNLKQKHEFILKKMDKFVSIKQSMQTIVKNLKSLRAAFEKQALMVRRKCSSKEKTLAFSVGSFVSQIYLNPMHFNNSVHNQICTLIHEVGHFAIRDIQKKNGEEIYYYEFIMSGSPYHMALVKIIDFYALLAFYSEYPTDKFKNLTKQQRRNKWIAMQVKSKQPLCSAFD